ncbi:MAG: fimbria major subunit [Alistipes sp.]|nr:fimbria major subunit [Alistipes sp.]
MKKYLLWSVSLLMAAAVATSCSKDKTDGPPKGPDSEGNAQLVIMQKSGTATRAADPNNMETPTSAESALATELAVYVFNEDDDLLEYGKGDMTYTGTGPYVTSTFRLTTGPKQFYVFSNTPDLDGLWGQKYEDFEKQILDITFTGNLPSNIATNNEFAIGTLWRPLEPKVVELPTAPAPVFNVNLNIGRLASKITLETVTLGAATIEGRLPGTIVAGSPAWTLRAAPNKMYYVGQYDHNSVPEVPFVRNMPYVSAVHTEAPVSTGTTQNPVFVHYANNANTLGASLYAVENTSERKDDAWAASDAGHLYYGNTTHIQMSFVYTPVPAEIYQADNTTGGSITGTAFWTATFNGERRLYGVDPSAITGVTEVWSHPDGRMYYNFPIRDRDEDGVDKQCRILRNHSYRVAVDRVLNYGRNEENKDVPPTTPIDEEDETDVHVTVEVLDWYLINQSEPL